VTTVSSIRPADIRRALGCGTTYAIEIKHGKSVPHPRLYQALAVLANVEYPFLAPGLDPGDAPDARSGKHPDDPRRTRFARLAYDRDRVYVGDSLPPRGSPFGHLSGLGAGEPASARGAARRGRRVAR
jgi:hypothetical protein